MGREDDIFGIVGAFSDDLEKPRYLTSFEVVGVQAEIREIDDFKNGKVVKIDMALVTVQFRTRMWLPKLPLKAESIFHATRWAEPSYSFNELFPLPGSAYCGFLDDEGRSQMDGTLYATLADARAACGGAYRGVAIAELWPIVLSPDEPD